MALLAAACASGPLCSPVRSHHAQEPAPQQPAPQQQPSSSTQQPDRHGDEALAKKLQNPVADLVSVPFQGNHDYGAGPDGDGETFRLNIQPVIPFNLTDDWLLVTRTIVPVVDQNDVVPGDDHQSGLGDTLASQFFVPRTEPGELIWGLGPAWLLPTATDDLLGEEQWGLGPTGVVLKQNGPWTYGALANHIWSLGGDEDRTDVNRSFLQPFASHTFASALSIGMNSETSYDWSTDAWTVPFNVFAAQVVRIGGTPVQILLGGRYYAETPDGGPEWGIRLQFTLLLPR